MLSCSPSSTTPWGCAAGAMRGCPVVAHTAAASPDIVTEWVNVRLYDPDEPSRPSVGNRPVLWPAAAVAEGIAGWRPLRRASAGLGGRHDQLRGFYRQDFQAEAAVGGLIGALAISLLGRRYVGWISLLGRCGL